MYRKLPRVTLFPTYFYLVPICKSPVKSHVTICVSNLTEAKEHGCSEGQFQCINIECILEHYLCDGMKTCTNTLTKFCIKVEISVPLHLILKMG